MKNFTCARCGVAQAVPSWIQRESQVKPWPHRCAECGATHTFLKGGFEVISPAMGPIGSGDKASPWYPGNFHPAVPGVYDTTWRDVDAHLQLTWTGARWEWQGKRVRGVLVAFRGVWL